MGGEALEKTKSHLWAAQQFCFCINIGELDRRKGLFPIETYELLVVRGTISFCNNKLQFCLLEKVLCGIFKCDEKNNVEGELFHFQHLFY